MKNTSVALLFALGILLPISACTKSSYPLSPDVVRKTEQTSSYRIVRKIVGTSAEISMSDVERTDSGTFVKPFPTYFLTTWLRLENRTAIKTRVTIDCRTYFRNSTPNKPIASIKRVITLQPWEGKTEPFTAIESVFDLSTILSWCGMTDVEYPDENTAYK